MMYLRSIFIRDFIWKHEVFLLSYIRVYRWITKINAAIRSDHNVHLVIPVKHIKKEMTPSCGDWRSLLAVSPLNSGSNSRGPHQILINLLKVFYIQNHSQYFTPPPSPKRKASDQLRLYENFALCNLSSSVTWKIQRNEIREIRGY